MFRRLLSYITERVKTEVQNRLTKVEKSFGLKKLDQIRNKYRDIAKMQDEEGFVIFWKKRPVVLLFKTEDDTKRQKYTLEKIAIEPTDFAYVYLFCRDSHNNPVRIDRYNIDSLIYYKNKRAEEWELGTLIGYDDEALEKLRYRCKDYFTELAHEEYLQQREREDKRNESKKILVEFSPPKELFFSIYGDYFDKTRPSNNMKYHLFCTGLYGFPDTQEITALIGSDKQGHNVNIRLNAILTMVKYNGKKYHLQDFIADSKKENS